jgi:hypothetical protein
MSKAKRPLWECAKCGRQFANRNQSHGCTTLTLAQHLNGKSDKAVALFRAWEEAIRANGPVRLHPTKTRIGFIGRMTFANATLKKDCVEAGLILPYRSHDPRFHGFIPSGGGGVHYFRIEHPDDIDDQIRMCLKDAYRIGQQEEVKSAPPSVGATNPSPKPRKSTGPRRTGKVFYLHFNEDELKERIASLCAAGHQLLTHWSTNEVAKLGDFVPDVVVISLDRLPSHGRGYASWIWYAKKRQHIPIIFAGGQEEKVAVTRQQFPKGVYCSTEEVPKVVDDLMRSKPV